MNTVLADLVGLLKLEKLEENLYRGESRDLGGRSVFGGQVLGQALQSAYNSVEAHAAHSLHAYFLRPGDMEAPIVYEVERMRDGHHFSARRVHAIQHGKTIFSMIASFQSLEEGLEHQLPMPDVPAPEALQSQTELRERWLPDCPAGLRKAFMRELPIEFKWVDARNPFKPQPLPPQQQLWFRAAGKLPDDQALHRSVLAYASDFNLLSTAMLPHGVTYFQPDMAVASLDHAIWFHRDLRVDDWLLYSMESPSSSGARGLSRAMVHDRQGRLVATVAQESLMRRIDKK